MVYRKGELSPAAVDRGWPHQVALPASACENDGYKTIHDFCTELSLCPRGHCVRHDGQWFNVYCFADTADAPIGLVRRGIGCCLHLLHRVAFLGVDSCDRHGAARGARCVVPGDCVQFESG